MAQDFGILITQPGVDVANAKTAQVVMNTSNPFIKIDTQTTTGFQTIKLLITTDPPEPVGAGNTYTIVYKFAHGYKYTPCVETLFFIQSAPPGATFSQTYFQDAGILGRHTSSDFAEIYSVTDATNVYFVVDKFNDGSGFGSANLLTGTTVLITPHVFVEDTQF